MSLSNAKPGRRTPEAAEDPAGIYVHIPFCRTKCPYCSFVSYAGAGADMKINYMQALQRQAGKMASHPWCESRLFDSLFIGGGTPALVDAEQLGSFIEECLSLFRFSSSGGAGPEVSLETNPNTVNRAMLARLRKAGVNRLSIGVQACADDMLAALGRSHSVQDVLAAVEYARSAGFDNLSLDLMYGLPGQTLETWRETLEKALELAAQHLSVYELTIEAGTPFDELQNQGRLHLPHEDETASMFALARQVLTAAGYAHYEISNYARPGFQCSHNINYWENGSYLGLGAGAVSCFSGVRLNSVPEPGRYAEMVNRNIHPFQDGEWLGLAPRFRETVIMGLRLTAGVSVQKLQDRFGMTPQDYYGDALDKLIQQDLLVEKGDRLRLTDRGLPVANQVLSVLV
jgi:oxygen-independent coproporphyrinogen-3 oxidase